MDLYLTTPKGKHPCPSVSDLTESDLGYLNSDFAQLSGTHVDRHHPKFRQRYRNQHLEMDGHVDGVVIDEEDDEDEEEGEGDEIDHAVKAQLLQDGNNDEELRMRRLNMGNLSVAPEESGSAVLDGEGGGSNSRKERGGTARKERDYEEKNKQSAERLKHSGSAEVLRDMERPPSSSRTREKSSGTSGTRDRDRDKDRRREKDRDRDKDKDRDRDRDRDKDRDRDRDKDRDREKRRERDRSVGERSSRRSVGERSSRHKSSSSHRKSRSEADETASRISSRSKRKKKSREKDSTTASTASLSRSRSSRKHKEKKSGGSSAATPPREDDSTSRTSAKRRSKDKTSSSSSARHHHESRDAGGHRAESRPDEAGAGKKEGRDSDSQKTPDLSPPPSSAGGGGSGGGDARRVRKKASMDTWASEVLVQTDDSSLDGLGNKPNVESMERAAAARAKAEAAGDGGPTTHEDDGNGGRGNEASDGGGKGKRKPDLAVKNGLVYYDVSTIHRKDLDCFDEKGGGEGSSHVSPVPSRTSRRRSEDEMVSVDVGTPEANGGGKDADLNQDEDDQDVLANAAAESVTEEFLSPSLMQEEDEGGKGPNFVRRKLLRMRRRASGGSNKSPIPDRSGRSNDDRSRASSRAGSEPKSALGKKQTTESSSLHDNEDHDVTASKKGSSAHDETDESREFEMEIIRLKMELAQIKGEKDEVEFRVARLAEENHRLSAANTDLEDRVGMLTRSNQVLTTEDNQGVKRVNVILTEELTVVTKERDAAERENRRLNDELGGTVGRMGKSTARHLLESDVTGGLETLDRKELEHRLRRVEGENQMNENRVLEATAELDLLRLEVEKLRGQNDDLHGRLGDDFEPKSNFFSMNQARVNSAWTSFRVRRNRRESSELDVRMEPA